MSRDFPRPSQRARRASRRAFILCRRGFSGNLLSSADRRTSLLNLPLRRLRDRPFSATPRLDSLICESDFTLFGPRISSISVPVKSPFGPSNRRRSSSGLLRFFSPLQLFCLLPLQISMPLFKFPRDDFVAVPPPSRSSSL